MRIVPPDSSWPYRFESEKTLLERSIGAWTTGGIHHVGSTAVRGLAAKPVIDILVGVRDLTCSRGCFEALAELDYHYAPYRTEEMHWFCKPDPRRRTHHLHLVPTNSERYRAELAFRDALRSRPGLARDYANLKRALARQYEHDRERYTREKGEFIQKALDPGGEDEGSPDAIAIGRAIASDAAALTRVFTGARGGMDYLSHNSHTAQATQDWLTSLIEDEANTVLTAAADSELAGMCVLREGWIDHLYVDPRFQGRKIGSRMLEVAQNMYPHLEMWMFQRNTDAIRLYERHGFRLAEQTDGSRNEEREPDARYVWDARADGADRDAAVRA